MQLINKKKNSLIAAYFIDHISDSFLEFSTIFASCHHSGQIKDYDSLVFDRLRNHAGNDPLCKPFYDCSLSDAWLTYQTWVVFCSSA